MKKLLLLILILLSIGVKAQTVKIGNITIDSATAQKYFLFLYQHPDTIRLESEWIGVNEHSADEDNRPIRARNNEIIKNSIEHVKRTVYYKAYADTSYDGAIWASGNWNTYKKKAKHIVITQRKAGSYVEDLGYTVPRKPSEIDFIKWTIKNKKP
jgi:hypothetical protein